MYGWNTSFFRISNDIATIPYRVNKALLIPLNFISYATNVNLNQIVIAAEVKIPDMFGDHTFTQKTVFISQKVFEDSVLSIGQLNESIFKSDFMAKGIQD